MSDHEHAAWEGEGGPSLPDIEERLVDLLTELAKIQEQMAKEVKIWARKCNVHERRISALTQMIHELQDERRQNGDGT